MPDKEIFRELLLECERLWGMTACRCQWEGSCIRHGSRTENLERAFRVIQRAKAAQGEREAHGE